MSNREYVNTNDLKFVASNMRKKKEYIVDIYENRIKYLIKDSEKCLTYSNQDSMLLDEQFRDLFSAFDKNVDDLIYTLIDRIIPVYEDLSDNIKFLFNKQFANEFEKLLNMKDIVGGNNNE